MYPIRPSLRATRCAKHQSRQSYLSISLFAHPGIRQEKEYHVAKPTCPISVEDPGNAQFESPKCPAQFQRAGLHARLGATILKWRKPTGGPLLKWAFPEAGCHVISVVDLAAKFVQHDFRIYCGIMERACRSETGPSHNMLAVTSWASPLGASGFGRACF